MEIRKLTGTSAELPILEEINEEAIPESERCALKDMLATGAEVFCIDAAGEPVGFMAVRSRKNIVYLAYLAVRADLRSGGIGGGALRELIRQNPDRQVIAEYEMPDEHCGNNAMRLRRKQFYLRNGFYETGWFTFYDETEFEIACTSTSFDIEAFNEFTEYLSMLVSDHIPKPYRKDG